MPLRAVHKRTREVRGWATEGAGRRWLSQHDRPDDWKLTVEFNASWNCHLQNLEDGRPHDGVPIYEVSVQSSSSSDLTGSGRSS